MMAQVTNFEPGEFIHTTGRQPSLPEPSSIKKPICSSAVRPVRCPKWYIAIPDVKSIFDFRYEDFELVRAVDPRPHIAAQVSV